MNKEYPRNKKKVSGKSYPLTHGQKGIWFLSHLAPDSRAYNFIYAAFIRPDINPAQLQTSLTYLARRHRVLNTSFQVKGSEIIQTIPDNPGFDLTIIDASSWSASRLDQWICDEADRPFDLTQGPLARFTLLNRRDSKQLERIFLVTMHHIISDHESLQIFMEDLVDTFEAVENGHEPNLPPLDAAYSDFVTWHNNLVESAKGQKYLLYWKNQLKGELPVLDLPVDKPRPAVQTFNGAIQVFWLEEDLILRLRNLSSALSCSLYTTLLHIFEVFLYKLTGQKVFLVGSATSLRRKEAFKRLIGYCVNPFVLKADLTGNPGFDELVQRSRENLHSALANSEYPFPLVVENLQADRNLSHAALFQATFNLIKEQSKAWPWSEQNENCFLKCMERIGQRGASFDLLLSAIEVQDRLRLEWTYNTDLFDEATIPRIHRQFQVLMNEILKAPDAPINAISMMTPEERQRLLTELNRTDTDYPKDRCIHHLFQEYAKKTPKAMALCFDSRPMTYEQLNFQANRIAHHLSSLGAGPCIVGLCMERSLEMVIGLLAILKSGSSYLPLDSDYPDDRISFMLKDSSAKILLTQERFLERMNNLAAGHCKIIPVEQVKELSYNGQKTNPATKVGPENNACIIYTSGSTGKPKGVLITHRNIIRLVKNSHPITFSQDNRQLLHTPISFDASFMEIWGSLLNGACLEIMPPGQYSPFEMGKIVREKAISHLCLTTALFNIIIDENPGDFEGLQLLAFGGESASIPHTNKALERLKHTRIFNAYGPTENTTATTAYQITAKLTTSVPIGKPISNTRVYLLDTERQPVPTGVTGELYLGGDGVAWGYHGLSGLTRERFIPDPFTNKPDHFLYKTGDLARYLPDGNLEFIGRIDNQVKIRGYRIEMGEIEHALASFPGIRTPFVDIKEDKERGKYLVAYLVSKDGVIIDESLLKDYLGNKLPAYMVPGVFIFMASFPLSPSNKIDRNALPEPKIVPNQQAYVPPSHPLEKQLCAIWEEVFNCRDIGINTNFFGLGGHSLMAARILSRIKEATGIELPLKSIFKSPTIKELGTIMAAIQAEANPTPSDAGIEIPGGNGQKGSVLSFGQQRLWFISQMDEKASSYNMPFALHLNGPLDKNALKQALNEIVKRHDILRSTIFKRSGAPSMVISGKWEIPLPVINLVGEDLTLVNSEAWRPFSLSKGPLIRATLFEKKAKNHILLITFHHIVADGWSMDIFMGELSLLYEAFIKGTPSPLKPLPLQFQDFAAWERKWFTPEVHDRLFTYWKKHLKGAPQYLDLPTDRPRPPVQTDRGRAEQFSLDSSLTAAIQEICRQERTSLFTFFYTAFVLLLSRYSGQKDILLGVPVANREEKQIDPLIGFFTNTLALRLDVSKESQFLGLLKQAQDVVLDGFTHQAMPFERLVETLKIPRSMDRSPLFQVMFSMEEFQSWKKANLSNLDIQPIMLENRVAKFDLTLSLSKTDKGMTGEFEYNRDLFDAWRIRAMADHFTMLLKAIVNGPHQTIGTLDILTREEKDQILARTIGAPGNESQASTKGDIFRKIEEQARLNPAAPALVCGDKTMTYARINRAVNHLAHYLKSLGIGPDDAVGVCLSKSPEAVTAMLAILKAGGIYVPLDPGLPDKRLHFMIEDSELKVLMAEDPSILPRLLKSGSTIIPVLTPDWKTGSQKEADFTGPVADPISGPVAGPDNLAYIIYTSGTTGRPKGVEITRGAITAHSLTMLDYFALTPRDRVLQFSALSFDTSLEQILPTLMAGACLVMRGSSLWTINDFRRHLVKGGLTVADLPPSYLLQVLKEWARQPEIFQQNELRLLICGGEPMPAEVVRLWRQIMGKSVRLINAYGPTEATITAMVFDAAKELPENLQENIPLGRPLANRKALILDPWGNLVPPGVFGELYLGGSGLARGYRNLSEQTRESFVPDHFSPKESRLYKTGDRAQYLPDGSIAFRGRMDSQIKIRGFRIEPMEVESALMEHEAVQACIVVDRPDKLGTNSLTAYIIPEQEGELPVSAIRAFLAKRLPEYMVPSTVIEIKSFPLTPNGKIDLSRLPAIAQTPAGGKIPITRATGKAEEKITRLWQELLNVETVGIHHNFFDLGGHSLLMIKLQSELARQFDKEISIVDLFAHPTIHRLAKFITGNQELNDGLSATKENASDTDIAVIGMALRVPGATSIDTFWENLCNGVESVTFFTDEALAKRGVPREMLDNPAYVKAGGILDNPGFFDAKFFGYTPMEARQMDPQHRQFLECAWEALEHAGYDAERIKVPVGVFAGSGMNTYLLNNLNMDSLSQEQGFQIGLNNDKDFLSSRVSYQMNLTGPAVTVQTACSTSLVAVNMACRSLETKDCEMALAGGVTIMAKQDHGYLYQEGMIMSPDGHCRAFDANASGTVGGNGAGIVVLKRLDRAISDGDTVYAVIKGSAINNDGSVKASYAAPGIEGQSRVVAQALERSGIPPETMTYIECHGTGTRLGDPIEISALNQVFNRYTTKKKSCALGSVKTNIGHLDTAAGITGFIKTVLAVNRGVIPPSLHFEAPNPEINFDDSPFYVNQSCTPWSPKNHPRRAGVSSFGIGGTNAHVVLEQAVTPDASEDSPTRHLMIWSAKTPQALDRATDRLTGWLKNTRDIRLADATYTLAVGRSEFPYRRWLVCSDREDAVKTLEESDQARILQGQSGEKLGEKKAGVTFLFPGQGSPYVNMAQGLYHEVPMFRQTADHCFQILLDWDLDLTDILFPGPDKTSTGQLNETALAQPALFVIEYALARLWIAWGVTPVMMMGHSLGEYTAACLAGVMTLK
jgi:amino acid adenylation domain-containing protein